MEGGKVGISRIIQADPAVLTERMIQRINLLRGVDFTNGNGHNNSSFGSNFPPSTPSADQVIAWSSAFYKPGEFKERSVATGGGHPNSYYYSSPLSRSGGVQAPKKPTFEPALLFDRLFMGGVPTSTPTPTAPTAPARKPIVDLVYESYRALRDGNQRLSKGDRLRLNDHMEHLSEVQRRVNAGPAGPGAAAAARCEAPRRSAMEWGFPNEKQHGYRSLAESRKLFSLYTDIIVAAFTCGITRVFQLVPRDQLDLFSDYKGSWHDLAHATDREAPKALIYAGSTQAFFEYALLELARKLDTIEEVPGSTYLDNTLIFYTQESSWDAHTQIDRVVLTIGNVNNHFKTGNFVDYRNLTRPKVDQAGGFSFYPGILTNQWWANVMLAFRIPESDWKPIAGGSGPGFGPQKLGTSHGNANSSLADSYLPAVLSGAGSRLPIIT